MRRLILMASLPILCLCLPRRPLESADLVCQSTKQFHATVTPIFVVIVHASLHDAFTPRVVECRERSNPKVYHRDVLDGSLLFFCLHLR